MALLHIIQLEQCPILKQLRLEEALLRTDTRNWCLINTGSPPAIVMGISGKPELLINSVRQTKNPLPVIRRFSGGGTVVVDQETLFVTFICNSNDMQIACYPDRVLQWSAQFYSGVFSDKFKLHENDYAFENRKFGGNAQYFRKERWLHHSSLLWDYSPHLMDYLLLPQKTPRYRAGRSHDDFLCRLKDFYVNKSEIKQRITGALSSRFQIEEVPLEAAELALQIPHRQATEIVI